MGLKDILVHVDSRENCAARVEAAARLAARHDAHLVGLYVIQTPLLPAYVDVQIPPEIIEKHMVQARIIADAARKKFEAALSAAGAKGEWRVSEGGLIDRLNLHGRYCDIVVVGQAMSRDTANNMPDRFILSVGRPVLLIPRAGSFPNIGDNVIVAWDAGRLAARAANDALPILRGAKKVTVLAANPQKGAGGHGDVPGADISLHLARHGVPAEAEQRDAEDTSIGDMLLSRAADTGADLIVMGAYGHARWRELVLGGVTQHMLDHMTVPVLMTH